MSREYTAQEIRQQVLAHVKTVVDYWAALPGISVEERCDGVAFSILTMVDGCGSLPAFTISVDAHTEDKDLHISEGKNWYPPGVAINEDCQLHDEYSQMKWGNKEG